MKWFPKIVEAKEILDRWYFEEQASAWRDRRKNTIALEPPPPDEETCAKMIDKFNGLLAELRGNMAVS